MACSTTKFSGACSIYNNKNNCKGTYFIGIYYKCMYCIGMYNIGIYCRVCNEQECIYRYIYILQVYILQVCTVKV